MATGFPSSIVVEVEFTAGVWTDITTSVVGDSIEITVGKDSPSGDIQPGTLDLVLDNSDGTWTPDNPLSTYYPNIVEGKRIRVVVNKGTPAGYSTGAYGTGPYAGTLTQSARFVGRVTLWEPDYPDVPQQSRTRVQAIDALGDLARNTLPPTLLPMLQAEYAATGEAPSLQSVYYWPLRGGYRYADLVSGVDSLTVYQPTTGGALSWESDASFPGGGEQCVSLTSGVGFQFTPGIRVSPLWDGVGVAVLLNAGSSGKFLSMTDRRPFRPNLNGFCAEWDGSSAITFVEYVAGTGTTLVSVPASPGWHVVSFSPAGNFYVDGESYTSSPSAGVSWELVYLGGEIDISARDLFTSSMNLLAAHAYLLDFGQSLNTITANVATQAGVDALNASVGWSSTVAGTAAAPPSTDGRSTIDVLAEIANSHSGLAHVAYSMTDPQPVILIANADNRDTTVDLTIDGEADLMGGPTLDRNVYDKVSSATAKNSVNSVTVTDATLTDKYGTSMIEVQTVLSNENMLAAVASDRIAQSKSSKLRLSNVTFDLVTATNDLYSDWFGLAPGERVRVTNLPSTYIGRTYLDGYVLGWTERPGITGYTVTLRLQPADAPPEGKYDDSSYGRYGWADGAATVTGGTAVGSTSNGTLVITTPSGPCLTTSAGAYPMNLDWNGEVVTITSAPASSTSPQTVTTTARGVNGTVARSHSTGEAIDVATSARFAL